MADVTLDDPVGDPWVILLRGWSCGGDVRKNGGGVVPLVLLVGVDAPGPAGGGGWAPLDDTNF